MYGKARRRTQADGCWGAVQHRACTLCSWAGAPLKPTGDRRGARQPAALPALARRAGPALTLRIGGVEHALLRGAIVQQPAHVGPPEALVHRVRVQGSLAVQVVVPVARHLSGGRQAAATSGGRERRW